jgi:hypothetical protein
MKIATWSGPRNISTAMMRAWENRSDCVVSDEPLYAAWLDATGADHPGRDEIIAARQTDWRQVIVELTGPNPDNAPLWYQKHMCHHLIDGMPWDWIAELSNVFLIRRPEAVVASYIRARQTDRITPEDVGLPRQVELFDWLTKKLGRAPPVIDSDRFLEQPEAQLRALCEWLGIEFDDAMLQWPPGRRDSDGIWAKYWYAAVQDSTGFAAPRQRDVPLSGRAAEVAEACRPLYERLAAYRIDC